MKNNRRPSHGCEGHGEVCRGSWMTSGSQHKPAWMQASLVGARPAMDGRN